MVRLPGEVQTMFAELSEQVRMLEATRTFATLTGSFTRKIVNGSTYWYFKTSEGPSGQREYFIGPDDRETSAIMREYAAARPDAEAARAGIQRLCAMLRHGGALLTDAASAKVVSGLANAGIFRLGAMLVGTHAYIALGNLLGVRWESALRTQDIDLAATRVLRVAVPQTDADLPKALDALNMGFLPIPGLDRKEPSTSFMVRGQSLRVDLLTPATGSRDDRPVRIARFNAAAQPLEMLGYLLEVAVPIPLLNGGATLVNIPDAARFALHKLIISGRRPVSSQMKATKDREQAAEVIRVLYQDRPGDLALAIDALNKRPLGWRVRLKRELTKLPASMKAECDLIARELDAP